MNIPTPESVLNVLDVSRQRIHDNIVKTVVDNINKYFKGDPLTFYIYESEYNIDLVRLKLRETLKKSNWNIEIGKTQYDRDGDMTKVTLIPASPYDVVKAYIDK